MIIKEVEKLVVVHLKQHAGDFASQVRLSTCAYR